MGKQSSHRDSTHETIASVYKRIWAILSCAVCGKPTRSPVSVCPGGHAFCLTCRPTKRLACFICRKGTYPQTLNIVNKISELLSTKLEKPEFEKALRDLFECPVCYKIAKSENEYEMCGRGHLVCKFCYLMTAYCPLCRETESVRKNVLVDSIIKEIKKGYKCGYSEYGCKETCDIFAVHRHEDNCKYRHSLCLVAGCQWKGAVDEIRNHGLTAHGELSAVDDRIRFSKGELQVRFGDDEVHPYWLLYNYTEKGIDMVVQSHLNSAKDLVVQVSLGDGCGSAIVFSLPVLHMADDPLSSLQSADHLEIPSQLISKYSNSSELCMTVIVVETMPQNRFPWLNSFNIFTAAFVINFLLFSMKHWGLKQKCS